VKSVNYGIPQKTIGSRNSSVEIANGYGLDDLGVGVRLPVGARFFSSPRQTGSGANLDSYSMTSGDSFLGGKAAGI
jgi:hypothetical protein